MLCYVARRAATEAEAWDSLLGWLDDPAAASTTLTKSSQPLALSEVVARKRQEAPAKALPEPQPEPAALTPAQQRQQAAAEQRERERVARANGTTVGLPAPPPLRMLHVSSFSRKREKTRKNVHLPQKSIFPSETEKSQPP